MIKEPARPQEVKVHSCEQLEGALEQGVEHEWRGERTAGAIRETSVQSSSARKGFW
jgi:hypothetical protein